MCFSLPNEQIKVKRRENQIFSYQIYLSGKAAVQTPEVLGYVTPKSLIARTLSGSPNCAWQ